jgi:hypothetical protein
MDSASARRSESCRPRRDHVRELDLCRLCLSHCWGKIECEWRNQIRDELCQEQNKCRRKHNQLLHVDAEDWRNLQAARWAKPAELPDGLIWSLACDDTRSAIARAMLAQTADERGEVEAC